MTNDTYVCTFHMHLSDHMPLRDIIIRFGKTQWILDIFMETKQEYVYLPNITAVDGVLDYERMKLVNMSYVILCRAPTFSIQRFLTVTKDKHYFISAHSLLLDLQEKIFLLSFPVNILQEGN